MIVTKFVITTSSFGIIIRDKNSVNAIFLPLNSRRAKAKAASIVTASMMAVVAMAKNAVFARYFARGTLVNASM